MQKPGVVAWCFLSVLVCLSGSANGQAVSQDGQGDLKQLYKELKEQKRDKNVEIYYRQETIIREPEDRDAYLKHLLRELNKTLKKGKKEGTVRKVEGGLVEIDKGAVHKIRERDVYIVYDSAGRYKSKIEVEAIADATSIAASYEQKNPIESGDAVKFRGQRKLLELGLMYGSSENSGGKKYEGLGMTWRYNLRSGLGFEFLGSFLKRYRIKESSAEKISIPLSLGARKYFYYPFWVSPFVGLGGSYLRVESTRWGEDSGATDTTRLAPYFVVGTQFSGEQFQVNFDARYVHGPQLSLGQSQVKIRPVIYCTSISFAW